MRSLLQVVAVLVFALGLGAWDGSQLGALAWSSMSGSAVSSGMVVPSASASLPGTGASNSIQFIEIDAYDTDQLDLVTEPCPSGCNSRGVCTQDGQCYCYDGWTGPDCSVRVCPNACHNHGTCSNGVCKCHDGWAGYDCSFRGCPNDCSGHGACHIGPFSSECICFAGYTGKMCEISINSLQQKVGCKDDCSGHGVCVNNTKCACEPGFVGQYCEQRECKHNCHGRGLCDPKSGKCTCFDPSRFGGDYCELTKCPNNCNGHGECLPNGACRCHDGYFGIDCHPRNCPENCNFPNGKCIPTPQNATVTDPKTKETKTILSMAHARGVCQCHAMFSGEACDKPQCPNNCSGNGECDPKTLSCTCKAGWLGEACNLRACPQKCVHGHCFDGKCVCAANWKGEDCSEPITCPNNCSGHGVCLGGKCYCENGRAGKDCSQDADAARKASTNPVVKIAPHVKDPVGCKPSCVPGQGVCVLDERNQYVCRCASGEFTGPDCGTKVSANAPAAAARVVSPVQEGMKLINATTQCHPPCASPGGHCVQLDPKKPPMCLCDFGYAGLTCDTKHNLFGADEKRPDESTANVTVAAASTKPAAKVTPKTPTKKAFVEDQSETAESSSTSSSEPTTTPALVEVNAGVDDSDMVIYADTEAARLAAALEDDQREDMMLLETLDQLIDY